VFGAIGLGESRQRHVVVFQRAITKHDAVSEVVKRKDVRGDGETTPLTLAK
jgi:hypothetical protein